MDLLAGPVHKLQSFTGASAKHTVSLGAAMLASLTVATMDQSDGDVEMTGKAKEKSDR